MRFAVVQLECPPGHRTATFQRALGAIDAACEREPAPDLILLPAFHDVPTILSDGVAAISEHAAGQTVAACGQRARTWGVYIAVGLAETGPEKPYISGVLLDRDGDTRLVHRQCSLTGPASDLFAAGVDFVTTDILLGRIAILAGSDIIREEMWSKAKAAGATLVICPACWTNDKPSAQPKGKPNGTTDVEKTRSQIAELARQHSIAVMVADVVSSGPLGGPKAQSSFSGISMIAGANGDIVAASEPGKPEIIWAELDIPTPSRNKTVEA